MFKKWCKFNPKYAHKDPCYEKIIDFYLWACPVEKTAYGAKNFKEIGWSKGHQFKKLKMKLLSYGDTKIPFISVEKTKLSETLEQYKQANSFSQSEVIIIVNPDQEVRGIFRSIRNAIAHGSFMLRKKGDDYYYFFENRDPNTDEIKARIVLKSSTLKSWIKIVQSGPK